MKLTPGIIKAAESAFYAQCNPNYPLPRTWIVKFNDMPFTFQGKIKVFATIGSAKLSITKFVRNIFWQGEYLQAYASDLSKRIGYNVDFTETICILPQYGETSRFEDPINKKMFVDIGKELMAAGIITIENI